MSKVQEERYKLGPDKMAIVSSLVILQNKTRSGKQYKL